MLWKRSQVAKFKLTVIHIALLEILILLMKTTVCWDPLYLGICSTIPLFLPKFTWFTAGNVRAILGCKPHSAVPCMFFYTFVSSTSSSQWKSFSDPDWVDWINGNSETTSFSVIALLFWNQDAYNPVPVQTCLTCVNVFPNQTLSAKFCFSLIDISSIVQYFKALAKYKLCF